MAFAPFKQSEPASPKETVGRLFDQAGGIKLVCLKLQMGKSQVYAYADPASPAQISFDQVVALTGRETPAVAEYLAALAGGVFLPLFAGGDGSEVHELTARSAVEFGELTSEIITAMADRRVDPTEARRCVAQIDEHMRAVAALRQRLAAIADSKLGGSDGGSSTA